MVSYNLHGCRGGDGVHDIERCVAVVAAARPVIAGLQEVDSRDGPDVWRAFERALGFEAVPGPTLAGARGHYGNLLLSRYPVRTVRHHDLAVDGREPRRAIDADLDLDGTPLRVIVTHLGLARRERRLQLARLARAIESHWRGQATLVLGDFNQWWRPGRVGAGLHPALATPALPASFPARRPVFALDQIWCYPPRLVRAVTALKTPPAHLASDHLPLAGVLDAATAGAA